jgi:hypothetical protein
MAAARQAQDMGRQTRVHSQAKTKIASPMISMTYSRFMRAFVENRKNLFFFRATAVPLKTRC